ncbi:MAG: prepilin-type N-terminal cleavage/methylation domain-containing protein [Candidatus Thiodiazotropha sp.]
MADPKHSKLIERTHGAPGTVCRRARRPIRHPGGFTLLEVMVALLLLAIIMTASVSMLFVNLKGWDGLNAHSDAVLHEHLIQKRVAAMIQQLIPLVWRDRNQRLLAMRGESGQFQFVSKSPQQYSSGGLFEYLLVEETSAQEGLSLVLYFTPLDPNATQLSLPENGGRRVLMQGLDALAFSYFGSKQDKEEVAWHDSWEANSARYPDLVRLTVHAGDDEGGTAESFFRIYRDYPVVVQSEQ